VKAIGADRPAPLGRGRGRERVGEETDADRWSPLVRRRGRAHATLLGFLALKVVFLFLRIF
jgi:hypothetical protein